MFELHANERLVAVNWRYADGLDITSGTWFFAIQPHVEDVLDTIRTAMYDYVADLDDDAYEEHFGDDCPNWGDALMYLDLASLGIRDLTPCCLAEETFSVEHDECLASR